MSRALFLNDGTRILLALLAAIVVAVAETTLYGIYLDKVAKAKTKERARREVKRVIDDVVDIDGRGRGVGGEKEGHREEREGGEEIWGRGVNGGMRRRVRERWKKAQTQGQS